MSTTTDLAVAVKYSASRRSMLLKLNTSDFRTRGVDLRFISAFPGEAEVLYPPLTHLRPTLPADGQVRRWPGWLLVDSAVVLGWGVAIWGQRVTEERSAYLALAATPTGSEPRGC